VTREPKKSFRYAGISVQFFSSVVVIDDQQEDQGFIARVRPTLEKAVTRGRIKSIAPDRTSFVFTSADIDYTFRAYDPEVQRRLGLIPPESRAAVTSFTNPRGEDIALAITPEFGTQMLWEDDITVRLTSEPLELEVGQPVTHKYLLYNGPAKPSLLAMMQGNAAVPPQVVSRYVDALQLNTLVDYQFPGWIGDFSHAIYWTHLVIACTNLLHWVLHYLYLWVPNYGLCIILLTVLVRGLMFPLSRKQALMALKMQALAPELKALQARYGEDRAEMAKAQMALYSKHGVNPFGTCWVLLLQMPVFMGLYYALQESIFFRLGSFWPTWIVNLAAPDMLFYWGRHIPIISQDSDYGGFLYLGPFLNVLPILAIVLMVIQQKMMTPPATDEQMEANQRVMTIMMCFMGLLFYKVAAGLCVYFIVSSVWGFAERAFLPKVTKPGEPRTATAEVVATPAVVLAGTTTTASTNVTPATPAQQESRGRGKKGKKARRQEEKKEKKAATAEPTPEEQPKTTLGKIALWWKKRRQHLREWWAEVLKQAEKK
jgi:YidC/Oxa1 family membrane protein insertase